MKPVAAAKWTTLFETEKDLFYMHHFLDGPASASTTGVTKAVVCVILSVG